MLTTYYFNDPEEALRRAKAAGKRPGRYFGGITLPSGKRGRSDRGAVCGNGKEPNLIILYFKRITIFEHKTITHNH